MKKSEFGWFIVLVSCAALAVLVFVAAVVYLFAGLYFIPRAFAGHWLYPHRWTMLAAWVASAIWLGRWIWTAGKTENRESVSVIDRIDEFLAKWARV